eukprot:4090444-Karenia_brevis.AAC.1
MEVICASVCLTTTIAFTFERRYRQKVGPMYDVLVHMQRFTIGARGNAKSLPMPWQEILRMLQDVDPAVEPNEGLDLPRAGKDLVRWVRVILKSSGDDDASSMA